MTDAECGNWLRTEASNLAACGCKQMLANGESEDYDIRSTFEDLNLSNLK